MKRAVTAAVGLIALLALTACVAGSQEAQHTAAGGLLPQLLLCASASKWDPTFAGIKFLTKIVNLRN